jgi:hypothetical protein
MLSGELVRLRKAKYIVGFCSAGFLLVVLALAAILNR